MVETISNTYRSCPALSDAGQTVSEVRDKVLQITSEGPKNAFRVGWQRRVRPLRGVLQAAAAKPQGIVLLAAVIGVSRLLRLVRWSYPLWKYGARNYTGLFDRAAAVVAAWVCALAAQQVPAYRTLTGGRPANGRGVARYPMTDKENYAKRFDFASRCWHGRIKAKGTLVDESAGSSGTPFNWVRSAAELRDVHFNMANYIRLEFPSDRLFTINAFSMGAWATGLNVSRALERVGVVKSVGPDLDGIIDTMRQFGPGYDYLITAYPPFLKQLCDHMDTIGFPWRDFRMSAMVAGEPITEALRTYIERKFRKVRSGYGASDVQIGIAGEFGFTVWLRQRMFADAALRHALLGDGEDRVPMVFQYNSLENFIEISPDSELVITVNSVDVMSPKVRYNVGDEGRVLSFEAVLKTLRSHIADLDDNLRAFADDLNRLPVLFLFGRRDSTISYMGANFYPQDVEYGLYADTVYARKIAGFCLSLDETATFDTRPAVHVELRPGVVPPSSPAMANNLKDSIVRHLAERNRDFVQSVAEDHRTADIHVHIVPHGTGVFARRPPKIKNQYLMRS